MSVNYDKRTMSSPTEAKRLPSALTSKPMTTPVQPNASTYAQHKQAQSNNNTHQDVLYNASQTQCLLSFSSKTSGGHQHCEKRTKPARHDTKDLKSSHVAQRQQRHTSHTLQSQENPCLGTPTCARCGHDACSSSHKAARWAARPTAQIRAQVLQACNEHASMNTMK